MTESWEIEFVPDDPEKGQVENLCFTGDYRDAQEYAAQHHPDYLCKEIVFHKVP
jgi:hypothetical protein